MTIAAALVLIFSILTVMAALCVMAVLMIQNYNLRDEIDQVNRRNAKLTEYIQVNDPNNRARKPYKALIAEMSMDNAAEKTQTIPPPAEVQDTTTRITHKPTSSAARTMINVPIIGKSKNKPKHMNLAA